MKTCRALGWIFFAACIVPVSFPDVPSTNAPLAQREIPQRWTFTQQIQTPATNASPGQRNLPKRWVFTPQGQVPATNLTRLPPGIFLADPYKGLVISPHAHRDDRMVKWVEQSPEMPVIVPSLRFAPKQNAVAPVEPAKTPK